MFLVLWAATCASIVYKKISSCRLFGPEVIHRDWNLAPLPRYHLSAEELPQPWETVRRATDEWFNRHTLFSMRDEGYTRRILKHEEKTKGKCLWLKQIKKERRARGLEAFAIYCAHKGRLFRCLCVFSWMCVSLLILRVSVFFADCDNNSDDHCLLGIIEREKSSAAILVLIHHCRGSCFHF